jgi:hypothetical protein
MDCCAKNQIKTTSRHSNQGMNNIEILKNIKNGIIKIVTQSTNEYILVLGELEKV